MKTKLTPISSEQNNYIAHTSNWELTKLITVGPEQDELKTYDQNATELLKSIYEQLKILNFQIATITENSINEIGD